MPETSLIKDFAMVLAVAGLTGLVFRRLGLSVVVGYLFAGLVVGPHTPPFSLVADVNRVQELSQLGLVFLMFFVGMGLSLERLRRLGAATLLTTALTAWMVFNLCYGLSLFMGWKMEQVLFFASMFMVSSSAIIVKMLSETGESHEQFALKAQGVTVLEDVVAVVMVTLLASGVQFSAAEAGKVGKTLALLGGFVVIVMVCGLIFLPKILSRFTRAADSDLKVVFVSGLLFAAAAAALMAGFSVALGAFLFGVIVAETPLKARVEKAMGGTQDMFSAMFFVSIGMLIDIQVIFEHGFLILGLTMFALGARILAAVTGLLVTGNRLDTAIRAGLILIPIGEFSYVIAQLGVSSGSVPEYFYALAVGASLASAVAAPIFLKHSEPVAGFVERKIPGSWKRRLDDYAAWLQAGAEKRDQLPWWRLTRARLGQILVELLLLAGTLGFSGDLYEGLYALMGEVHMRVPGFLYAYMGVVALVCTVLLVAAWRNLSAISMIYSEALAGRDQKMRKVVGGILQMVSAVGLTWFFLLVIPGDVTESWLSGLFLVFVLLFASLLWRRLIRWQSMVQHSLNTAMAPSEGPVTGFAAAKRPDDWDVEVAECVLPELAEVRGKSPASLGLRSRFGCTVVEIERQGMTISNPRPDTLLFPGDKLLLFGTEEQTGQARRFLMQEKDVKGPGAEEDFNDTGLHTVQITDDCVKIGKTLKELGVSDTFGIQILGIRRQGSVSLNPGGEDRVEPGDQFLVLSSSPGAARFRNWLRGRQES